MPSYNYAFQDNLPPITSSKTDHSEANMVLSKGFGGGKAPILYNHIGLDGPTTYHGVGQTPPEHYLTYKSQIRVYHHEFTCILEPGEFNTTLNPTARGYYDSSSTDRQGAYFGERHLSDILNPDLTGSGWSPCATQIGLYGNYEDGTIDPHPYIVGAFNTCIETNKEAPIIIKLKLDT